MIHATTAKRQGENPTGRPSAEEVASDVADYGWLFGRQRRHKFRDAADYVAHVVEARRRGCAYWPPETAAELTALYDALPAVARKHIPRPDELVMMGLPPDFGKPIEPFPQRWRERFFATLEADPAFCRAVAKMLGVR